MKYHRSVLFITVFMLFTAIYLFSNETQSKITEVTVYSDRAMVTRSLTIDLVPGENKIVLSGLPGILDPASVRVKGKGSMVLKDVKVADRYLTGEYSEKLNSLLAEMEGYEGDLRALNDRTAEARSEKEFVQNITAMLTRPSDSAAGVELDPDKWIKMVNFYREKITGLDKQLRETEKDSKDISKEINRVTKEINSLSSRRSKAVKEIVIILNSPSEGKGILDVSYLVPGPSWIPDYTVQVNPGNKVVSLLYKALVFQSTGEDWNDVKLSLSTAKPSVGGNIPELTPWYLRLYKPPVYSRNSGVLSKSAAPSMAMSEEIDVQPVATPETPLAEMGYSSAGMETGLTSVVFNLQGVNSVESDNQRHSVTVSIMEMPVEFTYSAVPKLSPYVYLRGKVKNSTEYPLLPGGTNIFLNGNFVAKGSIGTIAPKEDFKINLGIDEGFTVERKLVNRFESESGFFTKKNKVVYEYSIEIKNNKSAKEPVEILDQLPVSGEKDISVTLIEPEYTKDTSYLTKNEYDYLKWTKRISSGETVKIPFSFSVEYPGGANIDNLE